MSSDFGCYTIERTLRDGHTWLAYDPLGRPIVLKKLTDDCLQRGHLHPLVRDRLQRLREVPVTRFAGPIAVERLPVGVMCVSLFVAGKTLDDCAADERARAMPALRQVLAELHRHGLVHGGVNGRNVVVNGGRVTLIDASPFLHDNPIVDQQAVTLFEDTGEGLKAAHDPLPEVTISKTMIAAAVVITAASTAAAWLAAAYLRS